MTVVKIVSALIGAILVVAGVLLLLVGLWLLAKYFLYEPSGVHAPGVQQASRPSIVTPIASIIGAILCMYFGTQLGRFARGDFD